MPQLRILYDANPLLLRSAGVSLGKTAAETLKCAIPLLRRTAVFLLFGLAACAPTAEQPQGSAGDALLPLKVVRTDRFIASFDGLKLDAALFAAQGAAAPQGGWPAVVLAHGGGGDKELHAAQAQVYAAQGYVALTFSSYGHGDSEGEGYSDEWRLTPDIQSLIAWMTENAGVDPQRVGISGASYGGFQSWLIALEESGVRTAVPMNSALEQRKRPFTVNGVQEHWVFVNHMSLTAGGLIGDRAAETKRQLSALIDDYNNATSNWRKRTWADGIAELDLSLLKTPVLVRSAWLDRAVPAREMIDLYRQVPSTKALMLTTGGHQSPVIAAEIFYDEARKRMWFDYWLRGIENGILDEPAVTYSIPHTENPVNPGEWMHRQFDSWPPPAAPRRLYFGGGRQLVETPGASGELVYRNDVASKEIRLSDVDDKPLRVPEIAGAPDALPIRGGRYIAAMVRGAPAWQADRIVLQSAPLTEDVEFAGHYRIRAYASADSPEFQLNTQLLDIAADGTETVAAQGVYAVRGGAPGEIHEIEYEGLAGTRLFRKGGRIGLAISNSAVPEFKPFFTPARVTVHFSADRASFVEIPTLPAYALPAAVGGLKAERETGGVRLDWHAAGGDIVGYKIYRNRPLALTWAPPETSAAGRIAQHPVQVGYARTGAASFLDTDAAPGRDYAYLVSAVGPAGVEGPKSAAVQVRAP